MKDKIVVWHKPTCSRCIDATAFMEQHGIIPDEWREYLVDVPSEDEIRDVVRKSGLPASAFIRTHEPLYAERFADKSFSDEEWISIMHKHPELINRPVIIKGDKAFLGRSEEGLQQIL